MINYAEKIATINELLNNEEYEENVRGILNKYFNENEEDLKKWIKFFKTKYKNKGQ